METTRDKARKFIKERNYKEALKLSRKFDKIFNTNEIRILEIAYECLTGNEDWYKKLDINTAQILKESIDLLDRLLSPIYCINTKGKDNS